MTTHSDVPPPPPTWGTPITVAERPRQPWSTRRIVLSAAVAVLIVAGGTVGVIAATSHASTTAGNGGPGGVGGPGGGPGGFGGGRFGGGGPGALGLANALHGDFVVNDNGTYVTDRLQTGTVSAVSATDITIASVDGYTQTYTINSSTSVDRGNDSISKVAKGNTVTVIAAVSGNTATATTIEDRSLSSANGANGGNGGFGGPPPGN